MIYVSNNSILIVYKDRKIIEEITSIINDESISIITATSSIEALSNISFQLPKLIISEYELQYENGIDFCIKIRSSIKTKLIPFIIISNFQNDNEYIRAINEGADAFIVRPVNAKELKAHIKNKISYYNDFYQLLIRDELTNLYNRREFINRYNSLVSNNESIIISIAMIDIDFFKHVNDIHGHQIGDIVLIKLAEILHSRSSESFIPTRFGGEEFAILLPFVSIDKAYEIIESVRTEFSQFEFSGSKNKKFHVSFSCGLSSFPDFATELSDLLSLSDQALYSAKKEGRQRTYIYKKHMSYNDRFWEYFDRNSNFYLDSNNNDAVTGLPFLPKLLEFITSIDEVINSIGVLIIHIQPLKGIRKYYGPHLFDIMVQNIYSIINKNCLSEYASETYFSISSIHEYSFTILFPSLFDFTLNREKCRELFTHIASQINSSILHYPFDVSYSNGVIDYDNTDKKQIMNEISLISESRSFFTSKELSLNLDSYFGFIENNYIPTSIYKSKTNCQLPH